MQSCSSCLPSIKNCQVSLSVDGEAMANFKMCLLVAEMFASLSLVVANQMLLDLFFFLIFFPQKNRNAFLHCDSFYFRSKQDIKPCTQLTLFPAKKPVFSSWICSCTVDVHDQKWCVVLPCVKFGLLNFFFSEFLSFLSYLDTRIEKWKVNVFLVHTGNCVKSWNAKAIKVWFMLGQMRTEHDILWWLNFAWFFMMVLLQQS